MLVLSDTCDDEELYKCLEKVHLLVNWQWKRISRNAGQLKQYCIKLRSDADCLDELHEDCDKRNKLVNISRDFVSTFEERFCADDAAQGRLFKDKISCLVDRETCFKVCEMKEARPFNVSDLKFCQEERRSIDCFRERTEKFCEKKGCRLWEYLQEPKLDTIKVYCGGGKPTATLFAIALFFVIATTYNYTLLR